MRVVAIGVGGAGGRIVDALYQDDANRPASYLAGGCVLDTDGVDLAALTAVPEDARQLFGQAETNGNGTGGDREVAAAALEEDLVEMQRVVDSAVTSDAAAIILVTGLGGGTGSVATPKLADELQAVYNRPVYSVSVLPAAHEDIPAENPARALQSLDSVVDAQIVFDNDVWLNAEHDVLEVADELNQTLAEHLGAIFSAGEAASADSVGQRVVDASEIIATLNEGGLATIGYAQQTLDSQADSASLLGRVRGLVGARDETVDEVAAIKAVETTLRRATRGRLTLNYPLNAATSGLLVVSGPPAWLHQSAISDGQTWLSEEIGSVQLRTGDNPIPNGDSLAILVLFAGIRDAPRIDELRTTNS
ncbi:tubulin/FtsZ family protein [Halobacterium noricense]|uniref:tubulin/FtsZ family protein n=1 Tax=Halobacterium noricense TaxID=223182 RepID=UPI001E56ED27|nr:tubulin/FtsZ family protein [Halobacterium noricense]UHH26679.1 tubulin/FtsZ family protein [Halobacterium noricense]